MSRAIRLGAVAAALTAILAGCGPKGQPCHRPGDLKAQGGVSYVCKAGPNGNTWQ